MRRAPASVPVTAIVTGCGPACRVHARGRLARTPCLARLVTARITFTGSRGRQLVRASVPAIASAMAFAPAYRGNARERRASDALIYRISRVHQQSDAFG